MAPEPKSPAGARAGFRSSGLEFLTDPVFNSYQSPSTSSFTSNAYPYPFPSSDPMQVDDLLDFSGHPAFFDSGTTAPEFHHITQPEPIYTSTTVATAAFPFDLIIPNEEEEAELEWLSRFVDDSFSGATPPSHMIGTVPISPSTNTNSYYNYGSGGNVISYIASEASAAVPGRPRTKRTRPAGYPVHPPVSPSSSSSSSFDTKPRGAAKERETDAGGVRRCTHCASDKTPQWRTGPLGPKTLCNACGVRFKSGRLVPEYRPAASPTFVLTEHSNSHRKVMELRKQKELLLRHQQHVGFVAGSGSGSAATGSTSRPDVMLRDYEVC